MEVDEQILNKIREAENTLESLKTLVTTFKQNGSDSSSDLPENYRKSYMTLSTTKLFQTRGTEVFKIPGSVGLYFIVPNNRVKTAARSSVLRIVRLSEQYVDESHPPAFIQVGEWMYPLTPGCMVYRSEHKYYLFPDLLATTPGSSVGVVLPKSCSPEKRQEFENLILELVEMEAFPAQIPDSFGKSTDLILSARTSISLIRTESGVYSQRSSQLNQTSGRRPENEPTGSENYGKRIGSAFKAGGQLLSRGFELGAVGTANFMHMGTTCLKAAITKEENDRELPSVIKDGAFYAKDVTGKVLEISSSILARLTTITANLASLTACYVKSASAPMIDKVIEYSGVSQGTIDVITSELKDVGDGIVTGGYEAYCGLEIAANTLAVELNNNAVEIVAHCYGPSAANVLQSAGEVVGNVALTGMNTGQVISPLNIVDNTTEQAGLALAFKDCA